MGTKKKGNLIQFPVKRPDGSSITAVTRDGSSITAVTRDGSSITAVTDSTGRQLYQFEYRNGIGRRTLNASERTTDNRAGAGGVHKKAPVSGGLSVELID